MQVVAKMELCDDCAIYACNGDLSGIESEKRAAKVKASVDELEHLVPNFDSETGDGITEFSLYGCDCCGSRLHGRRHRFAILATEDKESKP